MKKLRALVLCLPLLVPGFSGVGVAVAHAAHADQYNCDDSYLPCDGSNLDYLDGSTPYPTDPFYNGLGDGPTIIDNGPLGDPAYGESIGDVPYWETLGDGPSADGS